MTTKTSFLSSVTFVIACASLALTACGDDGASAAASGGGSHDASAHGEADREVVITANDQMKFNIDSFTVQAGERVRLVLKNVGEMPKFSMGHNVVILTKDADPKDFIEKAMNHAATDYVPPGSEDVVIAHTKLLGGGEEDDVTFTVPKKPGDHTFVCSFPGHFQVGMKGVMRVE